MRCVHVIYELIYGLASAPVVAMLSIFNLEVLLGQWSRPTPKRSQPSDYIRSVILMPAHNEAAGISSIVERTLADLPPSSRLLVIADNCSDETASIARNLGADVIERKDPARRGKGFALAFGRDYLVPDAPDVLVVLDADCVAPGDAIPNLIAAATSTDRPVQAAYLLTPDRIAPVLTQISNFAFLVKNRIRQRGLIRHSGGVVLTGTGMAFPWDTIALAPLASADITEDLSLGIWLTIAGNTPTFADDIVVFSEGAPTDSDTMTQRRRWDHGFLRTAFAQALPLIYRGVLRRDRSVAGLGLHLLVPPLTALIFVSLIQVAALALLGASTILLAATGVLLLLAAAMLCVTWFREGRRFVSGRALLGLPIYILAKLPSYAALFLGRKTQWVRTSRRGD